MDGKPYIFSGRLPVFPFRRPERSEPHPLLTESKIKTAVLVTEIADTAVFFYCFKRRWTTNHFKTKGENHYEDNQNPHNQGNC